MKNLFIFPVLLFFTISFDVTGQRLPDPGGDPINPIDSAATFRVQSPLVNAREAVTDSLHNYETGKLITPLAEATFQIAEKKDKQFFEQTHLTALSRDNEHTSD